jgi:hypothetical protein
MSCHQQEMPILIIRGEVNFRKRKKKSKEESLTREKKLMK